MVRYALYVEFQFFPSHRQEEAVQSLFVLLETGLLAAQNPMIEEHKVELEGVPKSRLGQRH